MDQNQNKLYNRLTMSQGTAWCSSGYKGHIKGNTILVTVTPALRGRSTQQRSDVNVTIIMVTFSWSKTSPSYYIIMTFLLYSLQYTQIRRHYDTFCRCSLNLTWLGCPCDIPIGATPTIPKWHVIMMYLLGAILTLLSLYITGHTQ